VRGGFGSASVGSGGVNVGRGTVVGATTAKIASAGKNFCSKNQPGANPNPEPNPEPNPIPSPPPTLTST
jgi:hypothetical protein